jgi:hypothetical protein
VWLSRWLCASCKCKDRDGWTVEREGSREVAARVERDRGSLYICVKTPARSVLHEGTLVCMQPWSSIRFRCPAARLPTPQARAGICSSTAISTTRLFRLSSSVGDPALRTEATGICVVPWEEAPGDPRAGLLGPSEAFGLSPSLLIPGRAPFCSLCCQICLDDLALALGPSCWYLTRPCCSSQSLNQ